MSGSTFGLWMRRLLRRDVERFPVPDLKDAIRSDAGGRVLEQALMLHRNQTSAPDWRALDEAVFDLYDLGETERIVARDGLTRARWQWKAGRENSARAADIFQVSNYARTFQEAITVWLSAANRRSIHAEVLKLPDNAPLRVVRFVLEEVPQPCEDSPVEGRSP